VKSTIVVSVQLYINHVQFVQSSGLAELNEQATQYPEGFAYPEGLTCPEGLTHPVGLAAPLAEPV
jgi:hypothetical protein